jgi:ketosteroid isomerase-like protein
VSEKNVKIVRRVVETIGSGDYDLAASYLDPDAEWHNTAVFPGPKSVVGAKAIAGFWRDLFGAYGGETAAAGMEIEKLVDAGEVIVILIHGWGSGQSSGVPIETRWAHVLRLRDSRVVRVETHGRFASALEAAGLSE